MIQHGCIFAGHIGWRISGEVIELAVSHDMPITEADRKALDDFMSGEVMTEDSNCHEIVFSLCDEAEAWLNEKVASEDSVFEFYDGEFFYSPLDELDSLTNSQAELASLINEDRLAVMSESEFTKYLITGVCQ